MTAAGLSRACNKPIQPPHCDAHFWLQKLPYGTIIWSEVGLYAFKQCFWHWLKAEVSDVSQMSAAFLERRLN